MKGKCEKCGKQSDDLQKVLCMLKGKFAKHALCLGCRSQASGQNILELALVLFYFFLFALACGGLMKLVAWLMGWDF